MMQNMSEETMLILIHRHESDRFISAIRHVLKMLCEQKRTDFTGKIQHVGEKCIVPEQTLIDDIIAPRRHEIGLGVPEIYRCDTFKAFEQISPNIVMMNFEHIDELQRLLAERFCPDLVDKLPLPHTNVAGDSSTKIIHVQFANATNTGDDNMVLLDDWLEKKKNLLQWSMKSWKKSSCIGKIRVMQRNLYGCADETMVLSPSLTLANDNQY